LITLATAKVYYVQNGVDAQVLWNNNEVYVFMTPFKAGWQSSYLEDLWNKAKIKLSPFGLPANETMYSMIVFHIDASGVQRYQFDRFWAGQFIPVNDTVYAEGNGALWKWTGARFESADAERSVLFEEMRNQRLRDFSGLDGWSKKCCLFLNDVSELTTGPVSLLIGREPGTDTVSIGMLQQNGDNRTIFQQHQQRKRISRAEYESTFKVQ
jgi:hypothetical protein